MDDPQTTGTVRRVVTGHDSAGHACIVADESLPMTDVPGGGLLYVWGRDDVPTYPDNGTMPPFRPGFPGVGGCRFSFTRLLPGETAAHDSFVSARLPGDSRPGFHRTVSLDLIVVIEGVVALEVGDASRTILHAGDVVVQNGTVHRWSNAGSTPVLFAAIVLGADAA